MLLALVQSFSHQVSSENFLNELDWSDSLAHFIHGSFQADIGCATHKLQIELLELARVYLGDSLTLRYFHLDRTFFPLKVEPIDGRHWCPLCASYSFKHVLSLKLIIQFKVVIVILDWCLAMSESDLIFKRLTIRCHFGLYQIYHAHCHVIEHRG